MTKSTRSRRPDTSGTPVALSQLLERFNRYLLLDDDEAFVVILAVVAAFGLGLDPVWLLVVGPPSGAKTELLLLLDQLKCIYWLSDLTPKTLASGFVDADDKDPSLLSQLHNMILVFKEFTTVLEMHRDHRQEVLAQLREIYDGRFKKAWGTGRTLDWRGRMGFIAGVTPVIDHHHQVMGVLGQRFMIVRVRQPDRIAVAKRAVRNSERGSDRRDGVARLVKRFLKGLLQEAPRLSDARLDDLVQLASFVTVARSPVYRDPHSKDIESAPEPEMPARFARQMSALARGISLVRGHTEVTDDDLRVAMRVSLDCLPPARRAALEKLGRSSGSVTTAEVRADCARYSSSTVRRAFQDLEALGVVEKAGRQGQPDHWAFRARWSKAVQLCFGSRVVVGASDANGASAPNSQPLLDKHLKALSVLSETGGAIGLADLQRTAGLSERTSKRIAKGLVDQGYVEKPKRGLYRITPKGRALVAPGQVIKPGRSNEIRYEAAKGRPVGLAPVALPKG